MYMELFFLAFGTVSAMLYTIALCPLFQKATEEWRHTICFVVNYSFSKKKSGRGLIFECSDFNVTAGNLAVSQITPLSELQFKRFYDISRDNRLHRGGNVITIRACGEKLISSFAAVAVESVNRRRNARGGICTWVSRLEEALKCKCCKSICHSSSAFLSSSRECLKRWQIWPCSVVWCSATAIIQCAFQQHAGYKTQMSGSFDKCCF